MGLFGSLFGKADQAGGANPLRETLFGDVPIERWPVGGEATDDIPWGAFVSARLNLNADKEADACAWWSYILDQPDLESRQYLQAWHFLRQHGRQPTAEIAKDVLGVVIEVAMPKGLDLLAAYANYSARYINFAGSVIVWDRPDTSLDAEVSALLSTAATVVEQIGPWEGERPGPPTGRNARMSFLTPSGLHFGEGPMGILSRDPIGGSVIEAATQLMMALMAKTKHE